MKKLETFTSSDDLDIDFFERDNFPFIISDINILLKEPSFERLREVCKGKTTVVRKISNSEKYIKDFSSIDLNETNVEDALKLIERFDLEKKEKTIHLRGLNALKDDFPYYEFIKTPAFLKHKKIKSIVWFLGYKTRSPAHYHPCVEALIVQLAGTKEIIMIPPEENKKLKMYPARTGHFTRSQINFYHPENADILKNVKHYKITLKPGEGLFIPLHWVHIPYSEGWSLSNTFFWDAKVSNYKFRKESLTSLIVKYVYRKIGND